jgi:IrrE N-terminal-like domain
MSTNFTGDPLSDQQIVAHALQLRRFHRLGDLDVPDVVTLLEYKTILTRFGEKRFDYQIVDDEVLGGDEAITLIAESHVRIRVSRTTYDRATSLDRRARFSIAHEFAHGTLHKNAAPLARARQETVKRVVPAYVSVERQADVFASGYLVTDAMTRLSTSPSDLAEKYLISAAAADIRWEKEQTRLRRDAIGVGLRALQVELLDAGKAKVSRNDNALLCPACASRTLIPIGVKYLCRGPCDRIYDSFPDGDGPGE